MILSIHDNDITVIYSSFRYYKHTLAYVTVIVFQDYSWQTTFKKKICI